jgi:Fe2+ transport system protein A
MITLYLCISQVGVIFSRFSEYFLIKAFLLIILLTAMKKGERGRIAGVGGEPKLRKRLLDLGLTPKAEVTVFKKAPVGGGAEIIVRGYHLTLSSEEAGKLSLEKII